MIPRPLDLRVVLARPQGEGNVGAAARAVHNMGGNKLILIGPRCAAGDQARMFAASAREVLDGRAEYASWDEFFANEPEGLRFAFTARDGTDRRVRPFDELLEKWPEEHPSLRLAGDDPLTVHLVFGPEEAGLTAEDLKRLHAAALLPVYGGNPSLNLSQAVLLALFLVQRAWGGAARAPRDEQTVRKARPAEFPETSLRRWLEESGFVIDDRRLNALTILRRLILRAAPTSKELRIFEGAIRRSLKRMGADDR